MCACFVYSHDAGRECDGYLTSVPPTPSTLCAHIQSHFSFSLFVKREQHMLPELMMLLQMQVEDCGYYLA